MSFVKVQDVCKNFGDLKVLDKINLSLQEGGQYVIRGSSGSGKSTFLYLLGALDHVTQGKIQVGDFELSNLNDEQLAKYRNEYVGFVFQFHFLLSSMNCLDNIMLPAQIANKRSKKLEDKMTALAADLEIKHCLKKYPYELSGGEQQRVNILRAISLQPKLLLCDEPTGNLDSQNSDKVISLLSSMSVEQGATFILVTHDNEVASCFQNQIKMADGKFLA